MSSRVGAGGWSVPPAIAAAIVVVPIFAVLVIAFAPGESVWRHLATTVLPTYALNTAKVLIGVGIGVLVIGVATAWLVTMCEFPGRPVFEWALLLPMAIPAYVVAFVYTDFLEYAGPVQMALRDWFGWRSARDYWFPDIRTAGGAIIVMTLVLYPYVYLLARAAFTEQSIAQIEVARTLGRSGWRTFFTVALPLARPALVAGTTLALLEALNDLGTVDLFAVNTFTRGIFNVWLGMNNLAGAAQIAVLLVVVVLGLIAFERWDRGRRRYRTSHASYRQLPRYRLSMRRQVAAIAGCALPIAAGFVVPALILLDYTLTDIARSFDRAFLRLAANSLGLAAAAALAATALAVFLAYAPRVRATPIMQGLLRTAGLGYAMPGAVLAIGVMVPFGMLDNWIDRLVRTSFGVSTGLILSGTLFAVVFAYVVRFMAVALGTVEASFAKVPLSFDHAARTLGASPRTALARVDLPIVRPSLLAAALLVFVDVMKELPITLFLRPFNFNTLATRAYEYAGSEQIGAAAPAALVIVVVGILPVIMLSRAITASRPGARAK